MNRIEKKSYLDKARINVTSSNVEEIDVKAKINYEENQYDSRHRSRGRTWQNSKYNSKPITLDDYTMQSDFPICSDHEVKIPRQISGTLINSYIASNRVIYERMEESFVFIKDNKASRFTIAGNSMGVYDTAIILPRAVIQYIYELQGNKVCLFLPEISEEQTYVIDRKLQSDSDFSPCAVIQHNFFGESPSRLPSDKIWVDRSSLPDTRNYVYRLTIAHSYNGEVIEDYISQPITVKPVFTVSSDSHLSVTVNTPSSQLKNEEYQYVIKQKNGSYPYNIFTGLVQGYEGDGNTKTVRLLDGGKSGESYVSMYNIFRKINDSGYHYTVTDGADGVSMNLAGILLNEGTSHQLTAYSPQKTVNVL